MKVCTYRNAMTRYIQHMRQSHTRPARSHWNRCCLGLESLRIVYGLCLKYSKWTLVKQNHFIRVVKCHSNNDWGTQYVICIIAHFLKIVLVMMWNMVSTFEELYCHLPNVLVITFENLINITICCDSVSTRRHVHAMYIFSRLIVYCPIQSRVHLSVQQGGLFASRVWWFFIKFKVDRGYFYYKHCFCYLNLPALFNKNNLFLTVLCLVQ